MSKQRKRKFQMITDGYIKNASKNYDLDIPSEIMSLIFMFHFIKEFIIEYGKKIQIEDNVITNIDMSSDQHSNTTIIDDWMDPDSDIDHIHTIKVKILRRTDSILIGIVYRGYKLEDTIISSEGYCFSSDGLCYHGISCRKKDDTYSTGDIVSLTFNVKSLLLSYKIAKKEDNEIKGGIVFDSSRIYKTKYKWAIGIFEHNDSVEIIDIC